MAITYAIERVIDQAVEEAKIEGVSKGKIEGKIEDIVNMMSELQISVNQAMRITKLPLSKKDRVIAELEKNHISYAL